MTSDNQPAKATLSGLPENIIEYVNTSCRIFQPNHFLYCDCQIEAIDKLTKELEKEVLDKLDEEVRIGEGMKRDILSKVESQARIKFVELNKGIFCPVEVKELLNTLNLFNGRYDLDDARVFTIVRSLLDLQLTAFRMQRESCGKGVMITQMGRNGEPVDVVNPVEEIKRRYNESLLKSIEVLDKIIEGEKSVNVNIDLTENIREVWEKRKSMFQDTQNN